MKKRGQRRPGQNWETMADAIERSNDAIHFVGPAWEHLFSYQVPAIEIIDTRNPAAGGG